MSDFYNKYPYTDFHELNLDWVIERVKKLTEDWLTTQEAWNNTQEQWQQLYDYVHDYFANLDVQDEINNKINAMIADGTFLTIVTPTINQTVVDATTTWLAEHIVQPTTPVIDNTLTISGAAADAKVTGDNFTNVNNELIELVTGKSINISSAESVTSDIPIIANVPYVFDTEISAATSCFVNGYSDDSVTLISGIKSKIFEHSGYLRFYIDSQRTITGKVYIDISAYNGNRTSIANIPNLIGENIKTKFVSDSVYNTNRQLTTTDLTIDNYLQKVSPATYQYTFDPIRVRNTDGQLIYNLYIDKLATLQSDQPCAYMFDKYGTYLRTVNFNTMVNRETTFLSDEYFACLVEFPNVSGMKNMKWTVGDINIHWLTNSLEIENAIDSVLGKSLTITGNGSTTLDVPIKANIEYRFDVDSSITGALFVEGYTEDTIPVATGINTYIHSFSNSGVLRFYCTREFTLKITTYINTNVYEKQVKTYYVGTGKDFSTFTEMLIALENNNDEKIVYVDSGEYDIFDEMGGAEYIATISDPSSKNWREVCHVVPSNTRIIGIGNVVLKWTPDAEDIGSNAMAYLFSPLNVSGNCTIENITVKCKNGRYCIHDEGSGLTKYDNTVHKYINVKAEYLPNSTYGNINAYGSGHNKGMKLMFEDCEFVSENGTWATHDNIMSGMDADDNATIIINNCVIKNRTNGYGIRLYTGDTVGRKDIVKINNCYFENAYLYYQCDGSGTYKQGYDVTMIGCTQVQVNHDNNITPYTDPNQYNAYTTT